MSEKKRALLVDDNDELRSSTGEYLKELGYAVTTASGAEEALSIDDEAFDLLVSDVYMPGMNGIELADRWIPRQPQMAVLLISSRGGEPEVRRRLAQGDVAFLAKPFAPKEFASQVSEAVERASKRLSVASPETVSAPAAQSRREAPAARALWPKAAQMLAAIALVLGLGALVRSFELGAPPLPAPAPGGATRSLTIEVVHPLGPLAEAPVELGWKPVDGADSYSVGLNAIDGTVLWRAEVARPPADLPAEIESDLQDHVTYYWSVEALDADGKLVGRSELAPFAIEPTPSNPEDRHHE